MYAFYETGARVCYSCAAEGAGGMPPICMELERRCSFKCLFTRTFNLKRVRRVKAEEAGDHRRPEGRGYVSDVQCKPLAPAPCFHAVQSEGYTPSGQTHWQVLVPGL